jgi:hypothetical protein
MEDDDRDRRATAPFETLEISGIQKELPRPPNPNNTIILSLSKTLSED